MKWNKLLPIGKLVHKLYTKDFKSHMKLEVFLIEDQGEEELKS